MEELNLNLIPTGVAPVCHSKQYDVGRVIRFNLFNGTNVYTLAGDETVSVNVRKPDDHIVTASLDASHGTYVEVVTTEQMDAVAGTNICDITIEKSGNLLASLNFLMEVEKSPTEGGLASASEINNLAAQVSNFVAIDVADQYDSNNVFFDAAPTSGHGTGYAVTSAGVKTALDAKANTSSLATVATSGSYNDLSNKPSFTNITSSTTFNETAGGATMIYYKDGAIYILYQGEAKAHNVNDLLFTLPSGYRPSGERFATFIKNANAYGNVKISSDGTCVVNAISSTSNGRIYFNIVIPI